ncbi:aminotransferase class V-fold PLP-dependent enzyme [Sphingobacteriales bacterium UPWRP_1]|nr:selenocysteine lyase [Sphingobacteriales bacterium TSM_CSM]PSJ71855.1 aminotransferase class V-fold PLP-dependent enzyme [Sphingobacteriales bacterium UPWRP_1]
MPAATETISRNTSALEAYFEPIRQQVVGYNQFFVTPYGRKRILYADWTASGRLYAPIEHRLSEELGPFVGNTHTETTETGKSMTMAYHLAQKKIKQHVNAGTHDVLLLAGSGMTGAVNRLQRILGLRIPEKWASSVQIPEAERPVVFVTHMEHHSNHTSWLETLATVECIMPDEQGLVNLQYLKMLLDKYQNRQIKIASVTACSNVTGVQTPYHEIARIMHRNGGLCFVDFACSAPYIPINMHPQGDEDAKLDAIYFSPHKFLGGPGTPGVLIFDSKLYTNKVPDCPGGGTVAWTNPWGEHKFLDDIEAREDGGTPAFMQTIKAAMAIQLKEKMGVDNMLQREKELLQILFFGLKRIPGVHILAENIEDRLGVVSFYIDGLHYNLGVTLLNDRFGIQVRGGCSCAGTYGHFLLNIPQNTSHDITSEIDAGDLSRKPGWMRASVHPVMTNAEVRLLVDAIAELAANHRTWAEDYVYNPHTNEFCHQTHPDATAQRVKTWFEW